MTSTSEERRTGLLRKIRGLIDTADSYEEMGQSEAAQTYRNQADNLMTMYAIEEFELAAKGETLKQLPELREYDYGDMPREIVDEMTQIFYHLAAHCRCKIGWWGYHKSKIVGYPADLEYLDVMFTGIRMHMSANVRPTPSRDIGYEASLALLKESGMKWKDIYLKMLPLFPERFVDTVANVSKMKKEFHSEGRAYDGIPDLTQYEYHQANFKKRYPDAEEDMFLKENGYYIKVGDAVYLREVPRAIGVRFTGEYTKFCKETGRERIMADPAVWLRSFVNGYGYTIVKRLREMKADTDEKTTGKELVLRSLMDDLNEFFFSAFPEKAPHDTDCDCDACHFCRKPDCKRQRCKDARKPIRYRSIKEEKISHAASLRGQRAAQSADLTGRDRRVSNSSRKELE